MQLDLIRLGTHWHIEGDLHVNLVAGVYLCH
ncbi:Uncharacterised protein [Mycobacteroides abscessus subsp. abscessus]|nr:Uncharacterised protein [Mycobacteroides abscessus subsp. abscessus]